MPLVRTIRLYKYKIILITTFTVAFLLTRFVNLRTDTINPDAVNWHYRSQQFIVALKSFDLEKTYQHYHPGVTLMWITGVPIELYKQITGIQHYSVETFTDFHYIARLSLIFVQFILSMAILYFSEKIMGFKRAFVLLAILSFEPFFIGNSRFYHMDILFTLLAFLGLLIFYNLIESPSKNTAIAAGLCGSLVFLTRSVGIGLLMYFIGIFMFVNMFRIKKIPFKTLIYVLLSFAFFTFILFPALWKRPVFYLGEIFSEGERIGVRKGHEQIFFGQMIMDPGLGFYPVVLLLKSSPILLLGLTLFLIKGYKNCCNLFNIKKLGFTLYLAFFYIVYFLAMSFPSKKIDRYMLFIYPLFAYLSAIGLIAGFNYLSKFKKGIFAKIYLVILVVVAAVPIIKFEPFLFTYTNPLFGTAENANNIVGQKPFGVGIYKVKNSIIDSYGDNVKVGFIDTKPISSIYSNSKVFDIRVNGTSDYDIIVLAINETMPENVLDSDNDFVLSSVININGLDYWRIYEKQPK